MKEWMVWLKVHPSGREETAITQRGYTGEMAEWTLLGEYVTSQEALQGIREFYGSAVESN